MLESLRGQFICFRGTQLRQSYRKCLTQSGHPIIGHPLAFHQNRILEYLKKTYINEEEEEETKQWLQ